MTWGRRAGAFALIAGACVACSALTSFDDLEGTAARSDAGDGGRSDGSNNVVSCDGGTCSVPDAGGVSDASTASDACANVDLTTSANCGACGHDCFGGPCTKGVCGAVPIATGIVSIDNIEVHGSNLAVVVVGDSGANGAMVAMQIDGGALRYVATGENRPNYVTSDDARIYYSLFDGNQIRSVLWDGGDLKTVAPAVLPNQTLMTSRGLVWAEQGDGGNNGGLYAVDTTSGTVTPLVTDQIGPECFAETDAGFVFTDFDYGADTVFRIDSTGGTTKLAGGMSPFSIATDGPFVYWSDRDAHTINRTDAFTGTTAQLAVTDPSVSLVRVDATHVYWLERSAGNVRRIRKDGSGMPELLYSGNGAVSGLALDDRAIYFSLAAVGNVMKLAK
jgi:hypothetical protein